MTRVTSKQFNANEHLSNHIFLLSHRRQPDSRVMCGKRLTPHTLSHIHEYLIFFYELSHNYLISYFIPFDSDSLFSHKLPWTVWRWCWHRQASYMCYIYFLFWIQSSTEKKFATCVYRTNDMSKFYHSPVIFLQHMFRLLENMIYFFRFVCFLLFKYKYARKS